MTPHDIAKGRRGGRRSGKLCCVPWGGRTAGSGPHKSSHRTTACKRAGRGDRRARNPPGKRRPRYESKRLAAQLKRDAQEYRSLLRWWRAHLIGIAERQDQAAPVDSASSRLFRCRGSACSNRTADKGMNRTGPFCSVKSRAGFLLGLSLSISTARSTLL